jgi:hypothetical protein
MMKHFLLAALFSLLAISAQAQTSFWVATTGSDSNAGTQAAPFLTIQHADNAGVTGFGPGSTIHVAPGTYLGSLGTLSVAGTAASPITYLCDVKWSCRIAPTAAETNNYGVASGGYNNPSISSISSDSNASECAGATPCIKITLASSANMTIFANQWITIEDDAPVNTAANGLWQITVLDQLHFTLNNSGFINSCSSSCGGVRTGHAGAYIIFDGFEIDGTYPGTGQRWFAGIQLGGTGDIMRNMKVHDIAYPPGSNNGGQGGACIADAAGWGASQIQFYNNIAYHCGPKGQKQPFIHAFYVQNPQDKFFNNIAFGASSDCLTTWHDANHNIIMNNIFVDCLADGLDLGQGGQEFPHILTGTPANGSNIITGISTTAGLIVGMSVLDTTNTACVGPNDVNTRISSIDSATQIHVSKNSGSGCGTGDTLQIEYPQTGSYIGNNIAVNAVYFGDGSALFTNSNGNTYTNNSLYNTSWLLADSDTHVNDVPITPSCFVNYVANDGIASDFHLTPGCPAIAAGIATNAPSFDYDGNPVPLGAAPDIGAYAYNPHPHALIDKYWNWLATGFSTAFHKAIYAASTATIQGTNGIGGQTRIFDLDGIGDLWLNGGLTVGGTQPVPSIIGASANGWANTGVATSETNLVSIPYPALGANDSLEIDALFERSGTLTDTVNFVIRLATAGGSCTPGSACSTGSAITNFTANTSSQVALDEHRLVSNTGSPNAQISSDPASGLGPIGASPATYAAQTNAGGFINIDCTTATSISDTCKLDRYAIWFIPGKPH